MTLQKRATNLSQVADFMDDALQQGDYHEARIRYWLATSLKEQGYIKEARIELEKVVRGDDETLAQAQNSN